MSELINEIIVVLFILSMLIMIISLCLMGTISGKYFDRQLKARKYSLPWSGATGFTRLCNRTTMYLFLVLTNSNQWLFKIKSQNKYILTLQSSYRCCYHDVDYRSLARKRDWIMAMLYWGSMGIWVLILLVLMCLPK